MGRYRLARWHPVRCRQESAAHTAPTPARGGQSVAGGSTMLMNNVDHYLAMRRAAGFALTPIEGYLRSFARFAAQRGERWVVATTAIDWAKLAHAEAQRHYRLQTVRRFAR